MRWIAPMLALLLGACAPQVSRKQALATAYAYTQVRWTPEKHHVRHGPDSKGIPVQTPDHSIAAKRGWWKPGVTAVSMPYQWGGFDTPETFSKKLAAGYKAGDIGDATKRALGDAGVSSESAGIDCSGFVSRCWGLPRPHSTKELPSICAPITWEELQPGDILLNNKHVVLFVKWKVAGKQIDAYDAGPFPVWSVHPCGLTKNFLIADGYQPWRYKRIKDESPSEKWQSALPPIPAASQRDFWKRGGY